MAPISTTRSRFVKLSFKTWYYGSLYFKIIILGGSSAQVSKLWRSKKLQSIEITIFLALARKLKFICSEKATKFFEIFTFLLSYLVPVKSKIKISQSFVAFLEYMNFNCQVRNEGFIYESYKPPTIFDKRKLWSL